MPSRHMERRKLLGLGVSFVVALTLATIYISHLLIAPKVVTSQLQTHAPRHAPAAIQTFRGLPSRLDIPSINVSAAIEYLGITPNGEMAVSSDPSTVSWYKFGTIPGEEGSSVIAGHVVGHSGEPAVFYQLHKLKLGDKLMVIDAKGQTAAFIVRETKQYDENLGHYEVFNSPSGEKHLNLITCSGDWDAVNHHYLNRLVVFADIQHAP